MSEYIYGFRQIKKPPWIGQRSVFAPIFYMCLDMPDGECAKKECDSQKEAKGLCNSMSVALKRCRGKDPSLGVLRVMQDGTAIYILKESDAS